MAITTELRKKIYRYCSRYQLEFDKIEFFRDKSNKKRTNVYFWDKDGYYYKIRVDNINFRKRPSYRNVVNRREMLIERLNRFHKDEYEYPDITDETVSMDFITVVCKKHGPFKVLLQSHLHNRSKCPVCAKEKKIRNLKFMINGGNNSRA